jgi:pyruvate-formate lyase-activating enzyme
MTKIYHIVQFTYDNSLYVFFKGCNFQCKGCILKQSIWDCHISNKEKHILQAINKIKFLSLSNFKALIKELNPKKAVLGGGEPTIDKKLLDIICLLNAFDVESHLLTNGFILNREFIKSLENAGLSSICVSIKAYDKFLHQFYTGKPNKPVLDNFKLLNESKIKLMAESVLIPGLIEQDEIEKIAKFIAEVNPYIPYRIDGFIPINNTPWKAPSSKEVINASKLAKKYLKNVHFIHEKTKIKGKAINVYPKLKGMKNEL